MRYIPPAPCLLPPASKRQSVHLTNMRSAIALENILNYFPLLQIDPPTLYHGQ